MVESEFVCIYVGTVMATGTSTLRFIWTTDGVASCDVDTSTCDEPNEAAE